MEAGPVRTLPVLGSVCFYDVIGVVLFLSFFSSFHFGRKWKCTSV